MERTPPKGLAQPRGERRFGAAILLGACAIVWLLTLPGMTATWEHVYAGAGLLTNLAGLAVAFGRARVYRQDTWRVALVAVPGSFLGPFSAALLLFPSVRRALREVPKQLRDSQFRMAVFGPGSHPGSALALLGVLLLHGFGALTWVAWLGFSSDYGTDRQLSAALLVGAATWLVATALIVWLWRKRKLTVWVPFAWWMPSFLLMIALVY
jgi:hypothetical protein